MSKAADEQNLEDQHEIISDDDDDSEYTYVTDSEDEESVPERSRGGWFSFLRRDKYNDHIDDDDDDFDDDEEEYVSGEDNESVASYHHEQDNGGNDNVVAMTMTTVDVTTDTAAADDIENDEEHDDKTEQNSTTSSSDQDILSQIDKYNPSEKDEENKDESTLMAEAIQRVQQRIQSHGGNIYDALETNDQVLVDTLRGVEDPEVIREVVGKAMDMEEATDDDEAMMVNNEKVDDETIAVVEQEKEELISPRKEVENGITPEQPFIEQGVYVEESDLILNNDTLNGVDNDYKDEGHNAKFHENVEEHSQSSYDEEEEEEGPTLEEQRSLLSLAAEHDRVDVIKELLSISQDGEMNNSSLLCGFSSADELNTSNNGNNDHDAQIIPSNTSNDDDLEVIFVPPPLHAAVAHGSINAASCLLRMGADPSIRPTVPTPYLSRHYQVSPRKTRSSMEEDRNYKKYHDMSAWELAFGSVVVLEEEEVLDVVDDKDIQEESTEKRGWFGFGGGKIDDDDPNEEYTIQHEKDDNGKQRIIKRRLPLNIAPKKIEGIRHAFTAEALRAIGADEVDRLQQLLDSGMETEMEVAGKSLVTWAVEMEADKCCDLLCVEEKSSNDQALPFVSDENNAEEAVDVDNDMTQSQLPTTPPEKVDHQPTPSIQDERLAGLSRKDILTLIQENENLIPALTSCRDDLAEETSACQNILRDVQASGGRGGLSSQSLLDLVHSLKEKRRDLEESVESWRNAWEEREDELEFFWEEVMNDEWREHLTQLGVLDDLTDATTMAVIHEDSVSLDELTRRFCEVDKHVNTLRSSIASLAGECARYQSEVESAGLSGALSLTKSLREEVKEMEKQLFDAKSGEEMCRRKLELIQDQLTNSARDENMESHVADDDDFVTDEHNASEREHSYPVCQHQNDGANLSQTFDEKEMLEGRAYAEAFMPSGMEREYFNDSDGASKENVPSTGSHYNEHEANGNQDVADENGDFVVVNDTNEERLEVEDATEVEVEENAEIVSEDGLCEESAKSEEANELILKEEMIEEVVQIEDDYDDSEEEELKLKVDVDDNDKAISSEVQQELGLYPDVRHSEPENGRTNESETNEIEKERSDSEDKEHVVLNGTSSLSSTISESNEMKPSDAVQSGMSTALVVRQPSGHTDSLSLQIWDLIKRIVGLGRSSYRTQSESNTTIMIV